MDYGDTSETRKNLAVCAEYKVHSFIFEYRPAYPVLNGIFREGPGNGPLESAVVEETPATFAKYLSFVPKSRDPKQIFL